MLRVAIFAFSKKEAGLAALLGPARVQEASRESTGQAQGRGVGSGTSDSELSRAPGVSGAGLLRRDRAAPGPGFLSLTALTTEAAPRPSSSQVIVPAQHSLAPSGTPGLEQHRAG